MKLQQKQTPSFLDTFWSIDLIHRIVLQLVSVHQKSVYLYFFCLTSNTFLLVPCFLHHCCWYAEKACSLFRKSLKFVVLTNLLMLWLAALLFLCCLLSLVFLWSLLSTCQGHLLFENILESFYLMHTLLIHQQKDLELMQSILNWNSVLDQISFLICIFILVETGFIGKKCWLSGSAQYFWRFPYFDRRTLFWW